MLQKVGGLGYLRSSAFWSIRDQKIILRRFYMGFFTRTSVGPLNISGKLVAVSFIPWIVSVAVTLIWMS